MTSNVGGVLGPQDAKKLVAQGTSQNGSKFASALLELLNRTEIISKKAKDLAPFILVIRDSLSDSGATSALCQKVTDILIAFDGATGKTVESMLGRVKDILDKKTEKV